MMITTFNSEFRSECANRLGTHIIARNCSSSSTRQKHSCEFAIFYNLTADVVHSVCQFDYFNNTTVTPSILDGGSSILLPNMLSPKRLISMEDSLMAWPLPSHPYVLVNRSILCSCHLQTGLNYLLKSLSSCDSGGPFTMYFTVNSAFHHFMSEFGLSDSLSPNSKLLSQEYCKRIG